jgi:hypothetical protein
MGSELQWYLAFSAFINLYLCGSQWKEKLPLHWIMPVSKLKPCNRSPVMPSLFIESTKNIFKKREER